MKLETTRRPTRPDVFDFTDAADFLKAVFAFRCAKNPKYSIRAFAGALRIPGNGNLSPVLNKKRSIPASLAGSPVLTKSMDEARQFYWRILCLTKKTIAPEGLDQLRLMLKANAKAFKARRDRPGLNMDSFRDWMSFYIFHFESLGSRKRGLHELMAEIAPSQRSKAKQVIDTMIDQGLLRLEDGRLRAVDQTVFVPYGGKSPDLRKHHRMVLEKADEAIERFPTDQRWLESTFISVRCEDLPALFREVNDFHRRLLGFSVEAEADEVYQLSSQAFPVRII